MRGLSQLKGSKNGPTLWPVLETARYRIDSDTPNAVALTAVAAGVRFSDLAMRFFPAFAFAIVFSVRTSSFVHARRVIFLANSNLRVSVLRSGLLSTDWRNNK